MLDGARCSELANAVINNADTLHFSSVNSLGFVHINLGNELSNALSGEFFDTGVLANKAKEVFNVD